MEEGWTLVNSKKAKAKAKAKKETPVECVAAILRKYEPGLSDGYEHYIYYAPEKPEGELTADSLVEHIAKEIIHTLNHKQ